MTEQFVIETTVPALSDIDVAASYILGRRRIIKRVLCYVTSDTIEPPSIKQKSIMVPP